MKRLTSPTTEDDAVLPLKKRTSPLFSFNTINRRENVNKSNNDSNCNSTSSSTIGLDLMVQNASDKYVLQLDQPLANPLLVNASDSRPTSAPALSSTEDSSCTEDEQEDLFSLTSCTVKPPANAALHKQEEPLLEKGDIQSEILCHPKSTEDSNRTATSSTDLRSGLVFEAGSGHYDRHNRLHKERPLRINSIMEFLKEGEDPVYSRCHVLNEDTSLPTQQTQAATAFLDDEDYLRVHLPGYMKRLENVFECRCCDNDRLDREAEQYKSIFFTQDSLKEAKQAAASLCSLVENVVQGDLDNGFAVIRPPGHHAEEGLAGGYCIINNVAVATAYAREKLGVGKILIVDWDVHIGNGTQSIFLKDPDTLYFSVHRWEGGNFFPFLSNGGPTNVGVGKGAGFNMNVAWSRKGMGDDEYLAVWERLLMPVAKEFQPELILVSSGFDAAEGDLGECMVTPECFGRLTRSLMTLNTPIVCALEGGYVRSVLGKCVQNVVTSLLDPNSPEMSRIEESEDQRQRGVVDVLDTIDPVAAKNIKSTIAAHKTFWSCLRA